MYFLNKCIAEVLVQTQDNNIMMIIGTKITEVNLSAIIYRVFHEDFSPIVGTNIQSVWTVYLF